MWPWVSFAPGASARAAAVRLLDTGARSAGTGSGAPPGQREAAVLVRRAAVEVVGHTGGEMRGQG